MVMNILRAIAFGLTGALAMFVLVTVDDGSFETVSQLRHGPEGRTWFNPASFLVQSRQEGARKALQRKCSDDRQKVERAIFVRQICTTARSRTCVMGRPRWSGGEIRAPLVREELWDYPALGDRFSMLGTEKLRFQLSEKGHVLNEALSKGAVDFERQIVAFDDETLATDYLSKIAGVCGALELKEPSRIIRTGETG
ncbi:MAG TPA: hypothetical protein VIT45_04335 [Allosphingosinicella sp.]